MQTRLQAIESSISSFDSKLELILDRVKGVTDDAITSRRKNMGMSGSSTRNVSESPGPSAYSPQHAQQYPRQLTNEDTLAQNRTEEGEEVTENLMRSQTATELQHQEENGENQLNTDQIFPRHDWLAPMHVIHQIDSKIFNRVSPMNPFRKACEEFLEFYQNYESLCLDLAKSFLEVSHFWIIPGGITEINRQYVLDHPFTACVFVLLAMCFDVNYKYVEEQNKLYQLTTKILGIALLTEPLTDHDIEGILYLSLYNFARKPHQPVVDSWLLTSVGVKHLMMSIDLKNIAKRVSEGSFNADDLFHMRIFNSMCSCHLQNAIGYGRPITINKDYFDLHALTIRFPSATVGDAIKVAEIELYLILSRDLSSGSQALKLSFENNLLISANVHEWKLKWNRIMSKDVSQLATILSRC
ncbi:unnamed protein product [Ambrosiozyma monospora]|uniref:Unnamed protein product n=1 Tax=Ambrosiozyma monospora TaxID=43982 RepID=A0ACB5T958_AMBMO|nr:unnamed protein product [Ambrosiozyma monospora]